MEVVLGTSGRPAADPPAGTELEETYSFRPAVVVSTAILTVAGECLQALLLNREGAFFALPRSVPRRWESLDQTARACTRRMADCEPGYLEQLFTLAEPREINRERVLEVVYLALCLPPAQAPAPGGAWIPLDGSDVLPPECRATFRYARERLAERLAQGTAADSLLPSEFSLSDLQRVYEAVQGRTLDKRNFRKWALAAGFLEATARERRDGAHRPARLYRFVGAQPAVIEGARPHGRAAVDLSRLGRQVPAAP